EILVRVTLGVPHAEMLDEVSARGVWPIVARISLRRRTEQLLPASAAMQLIGVLQHVSGFVPENAHALRHGPALHVDDLLSLQPPQARMGKIERDRDPRRVVRAEPLA